VGALFLSQYACCRPVQVTRMPQGMYTTTMQSARQELKLKAVSHYALYKLQCESLYSAGWMQCRACCTAISNSPQLTPTEAGTALFASWVLIRAHITPAVHLLLPIKPGQMLCVLRWVGSDSVSPLSRALLHMSKKRWMPLEEAYHNRAAGRKGHHARPCDQRGPHVILGERAQDA